MGSGRFGPRTRHQASRRDRPPAQRPSLRSRTRPYGFPHRGGRPDRRRGSRRPRPPPTLHRTVGGPPAGVPTRVRPGDNTFSTSPALTSPAWTTVWRRAPPVVSKANCAHPMAAAGAAPRTPSSNAVSAAYSSTGRPPGPLRRSKMHRSPRRRSGPSRRSGERGVRANRFRAAP